MAESSDLTCFSESHTEAREKCVEAARARSGTDTKSLLVHVDAQGEERSRADIVVVTGGVHGVEGCASSAIQTQLRKREA